MWAASPLVVGTASSDWSANACSVLWEARGRGNGRQTDRAGRAPSLDNLRSAVGAQMVVFSFTLHPPFVPLWWRSVKRTAPDVVRRFIDNLVHHVTRPCEKMLCRYPFQTLIEHCPILAAELSDRPAEVLLGGDHGRLARVFPHPLSSMRRAPLPASRLCESRDTRSKIRWASGGSASGRSTQGNTVSALR